MRSGSFFAVTVLLAWGLTVGHSGQSVGTENQALNIVFSARPVKKQFELGERIMFSFSLQNNGQQDVAVTGAFIMGHDIGLEITGPDGDKVQGCGAMPKVVIEKLAIIQPGKRIAARRNILCDEETGRGGFAITEPGKYRAVAYYLSPQPLKSLKRMAGDAIVGKGPFKAKPVGFELVPKNATKDGSD